MAMKSVDWLTYPWEAGVYVLSFTLSMSHKNEQGLYQLYTEGAIYESTGSKGFMVILIKAKHKPLLQIAYLIGENIIEIDNIQKVESDSDGLPVNGK